MFFFWIMNKRRQSGCYCWDHGRCAVCHGFMRWKVVRCRGVGKLMLSSFYLVHAILDRRASHSQILKLQQSITKVFMFLLLLSAKLEVMLLKCWTKQTSKINCGSETVKWLLWTASNHQYKFDVLPRECELSAKAIHKNMSWQNIQKFTKISAKAKI